MAVSYCGDSALSHVLSQEAPLVYLRVLDFSQGLEAYRQEDEKLLSRTARSMESIEEILGIPVQAIAARFFPGEAGDSERDATEELLEKEGDNDDDSFWFQYIETKTKFPGLSVGIFWREEYDAETATFMVDHCHVILFTSPANLLGEEVGLPDFSLVTIADRALDV